MKEMARLGGESSNSLLEALLEWERHLQGTELAETLKDLESESRCSDVHLE